ncbi:MAG: calcium-binding protein [Thermodesulfobacteriota bacterium]
MHVPVSSGPFASGSQAWASGWTGKLVAPQESYRQISELFYSQLMAQTHLRGLWGLVAYTWDDNKQEYASDMSPVIETMMGWFAQTTPLAAQSQTTTGIDEGTAAAAGATAGGDQGLALSEGTTPDEGIQYYTAEGLEDGTEPPPVPVPATREEAEELLSEFARSIRPFSGQDRVHCLPCREMFIGVDPALAWVIDTGGMDVIDGPGHGVNPWSPHVMGTDNAEAIRDTLNQGDGWINSQYGNDVVYGTDRDETLINMDGDALLVAGGGNDQIWAGEGNDILDPGPGNDLLKGDLGNDTYIVRRYSGNDTIIDVDPTPGNVDTIWLGSNLTPADVYLKRSGTDLVLRINDTEDKVTVKDYFRNDSTLNRIEQIQFMDGTV